MERWIPILSTLPHYREIRELEERRDLLTRDSILCPVLKRGKLEEDQGKLGEKST